MNLQFLTQSLCLSIEIVTPYFCFYTGTVMVGKMKDALRSGSQGAKADLIADYCSAVETKSFTARQNLMDRTLHGKHCIEMYKEVYSNALATKFDPVSREITSREMCAEFVKMINTLLDMGKSNLQNATRYSYLISLHVDLESQQVDTFGGCVDHEAEMDPRQACIDIMTKRGHFDLYSNNDKA